MTVLKQLYRLLSSYGLAVVLFILMFFLILFGTLHQIDNGLYSAQKNYFESLYVIHHIGPIAIPLPGGYSLLAAFGVAIVCGILRIRRAWNRAGLIISHLGVLVMLVSSAITFHFSDRGHMRLYPQQQSDEFSSYNDWNIEIGKPAAGAALHLIPDKQFADLGPGKSRTFFAPALPFEMTVTRYARNAVPIRQNAAVEGETGPVVDEFRLLTLPEEKEAELNVPGAYFSVKDKATGETSEGILWGLASEPLTVKSGDVYYTIGLERKRFRAPFTVYLDEFKAEFHPGTAMASAYESHITKKENGQEEKIDIYMNHPLRHHGLTFFQASYGPPNARPGDTMYTVFEVVRNPADQGPLVACIIVGAGLLIHFVQKLLAYMKAEGRRRLA
jgi:hypothetical protein